MVTKQQVDEVLQQVRTNLQIHGGDVELVAVSEDGVVSVRLQGACKGCPMAQQQLVKAVE